jgi:multidrug efflux pump subunit AcrB
MGMKKKSFTIIIAFIALSLVGCALMAQLPIKLAPSQNMPSITISFNMPNNSARIVEQSVTSRLESSLSRIRGVKNINSKSYNGGGQISIDFDRHTDLDVARFEAATIVRQIWNELPHDADYPTIALKSADKESSRPFMIYTINAPLRPIDIKTYCEENLSPILAKIQGVYKIELKGAQPLEWRLQYDIDQLTALSLNPNDLQTAIREYYDSQFVGTTTISKNHSEQSLRLILKSEGNNNYFNPREITIGLKSGEIITLDKLVKVSQIESIAKNIFRINGLNSINLSITAEDTANQLDVANQVKAAINKFVSTIPKNYDVAISYDATEHIRSELDTIYFRTGLTILLLLFLVGLVSFNIRYVLLIAISLVINIAVAAMFYYIVGVEIQMYSLAGIVISLNLVIDNIIVIADHYLKRHDLKAFTAVLAATLTSIGALSVVYFMSDRTRLVLEDFVNVVIINLFISLAVALWLVPALIDRLGIKKKIAIKHYHGIKTNIAHLTAHVYNTILTNIVRFRTAIIIIIILAFGIPIFMLPEKIDNECNLAKYYNATLGSNTYRETIKPALDAVLGGTLRLFVEKVYNGSYWDIDENEPVLTINATLPNGATIEQMDILMQKMEAYLRGFTEIRQFQTNILSANRASISVFFVEEHQHDVFPYQLKQDVISKALTLGGGSWSVYGVDDQAFSNDIHENVGNYCIKMTGYNYDELSYWANRLSDSLLTHNRIKEVTISSEHSYWKDDYSEFNLAIDKDRLAQKGITTTQLFKAIEPTFGHEINCGYVNINQNSQSINLYSIQSDMYDIFALMSQPFTIGDTSFKLSDICHIEKTKAPINIVKNNQEYVLFLQYEYIGSNIQGEKVLNRYIQSINDALPIGYKAENNRHNWNPAEDGQQYWLILLVVTIIFFITAILFNSLKQPLAIIFIIPISFIGVFMTFYMFNIKFDQGGFASFILLAGITVNAAIYILNEYNHIQHSSHPKSDLIAYQRAIRAKIIPIMLTILSTILGFIPFIVGTAKESFWYPLAIGTIGGLAMSLVAIILIFPVFILPKHKVTN